MSDNTQLNTGTGGDVVRTIDKTAFTGAKVQAVALDVGGGDGTAEALVSQSNPLPVSGTVNVTQQASDAANPAFITGDPNGDFAGVNLLEEAFKGNLQLPVVDPTILKGGDNGGQVAADGPVFTGTILPGKASSNILGVIDTLGYTSFTINVTGQSGATGGAAIAFSVSDDGINWSTIPVLWWQWLSTYGVTTTSPSLSSNAFGGLGGCYGRYLIVSTTSNSVTKPISLTVRLRQIQAPFQVQANSGALADPQETSVVVLPVAGVYRGVAASTASFNTPYGLTMSSALQLVQKPYGSAEYDWQYSTAGTPITTATTVALQAAGGANMRNYCTAIQYQNTGTTATEIQILDGSTVVWDGYASASMSLPATIEFPTPIHGTAVTAMNLKVVTAGANLIVSAQGYVSP